jgi:integrase/recombinase XerC
MTDGLLATDVSRFLRYLGVERQLSPITLLNYQRQLDAIMQIADEIGLKSWQQCDAATVRGFVVRSRKKSQPGKPGAQALCAAQFLRLAGQPGRLKANPAKGSPRRKRRAICLKISTSTT